MLWANVKRIFRRELRDQLRDRRTLFTIAILPVLMYPLLGMTMLQIGQFSREHSTSVVVLGSENLPGDRQLINEDQFVEQFCPPEDAKLIKLKFQAPEAIQQAIVAVTEAHDEVAKKERLQTLQQLMNASKIDAIVTIPDGFVKAIESEDETKEGANHRAANLSVFVNSASDKSRMASERLTKVFGAYRNSIVVDNLLAKSVSEKETSPFQIVNHDMASETRKQAAIWSRILPFVVLVWALTGAFYPAIDLCAGEKERGTLETLLCSPAKRSEIVCGKLLTIMTFSVTTSLLNLLSMTFTGMLVINAMASNMPSSAMSIGPPPIYALGWLVLVLFPIAALFSALSLAVASFARSSKEGQYYLMPLLMVVIPLLMLPMMPAAELDLGTSLIPVTGVMLLLRSLIEGRYAEVLPHVIPVIGVTTCCVILAIRWAVNQFNNESVLFRESERFGVGSWLKSVVRDRRDLPTYQMAIMCGVLLLVIRFFASLAGQMPVDWNAFVKMHFITMLCLIVTPVILMALMLTKKPFQSLNLRRPPLLAIPAAILLAIMLHPLAVLLVEGITKLYPLSEEMKAMGGMIGQIFSESPSIWMSLLVIALVPAICEELAFRGFILQGLLQGKSKVSAIVISSLFFGAAHAILQQSISAFIMGTVIGFIAVQSRSVLPCIAYHFMHNSMNVILGKIAEWQETVPLLNSIFSVSENSVFPYRPVATVVMAIFGILILAWFKKLDVNGENSQKSIQATVNSASVAI